jgi:hypothetical protein
MPRPLRTNKEPIMTRSSFSSHRLLAAAMLAALLLAGCDEMNQIDKGVAQRPAGAGTGFLPTLDERVTGQPKSQPAEATTPTPPAAAPGANAAPPTENLQKAEDVVGRQRDYGGGAIMSPITTPISQYFSMRDRIPLLQIQHDMDIYKAIHNNKYPKDMEEFRKEILEPANIELPELPPGAEYVYDGKTGELLVRDSGNRSVHQ